MIILKLRKTQYFIKNSIYDTEFSSQFLQTFLYVRSYIERDYSSYLLKATTLLIEGDHFTY